MTDLQALLEAHQSTRLLRLSFPKNDGPQAKLMVNRFEGTEYLSRDFEFKVELLSDDGRIELEAMHGKLLCVSLVQADGSLPLPRQRRGEHGNNLGSLCEPGAPAYRCLSARPRHLRVVSAGAARAVPVWPGIPPDPNALGTR